MNMQFALVIIWSSLVFCPALCFWVVRLVGKNPDKSLRRPLIISVGSLVLLSFAIAIGVSSTISYINFSALGLGYFAYCLIAASTQLIKNKFVRAAAFFVTNTPIVIGYVMATVDSLGLSFIVGDYAESPIKVQRISTSLTCEVHHWGMAASDSGYTVTLFESWHLLPIIQRRIYSVATNETHPTSGTPHASCENAFIQMQRDVTNQ
ncbi:hypothetical protein [Undibacterium sp. Xuan67W]|uniref:hypothetical protein n=1 Tax=Undibacterium sp. Xuan67W TaxID=3413057 RepID=UPI003BF2BF7C